MSNNNRVVTARFSAFAVLIVVSVGAVAEQSAAQEKQPEFVGLLGCVDCHERASLLRKRAGIESFVELTEALDWVERDRHSHACNHIDPAQSKLAEQIYKRLNIPIADWTSQRQCLSCHANWLPQQTALPPNYMEGVGCESCHGPSSNWDAVHRKVEWRTTKRADKMKLGMIPVRHPVARSEQCFSCHIGNAKEQKVVTHTMYAAGHPPLPNVEIESFVRKMPRHWRYLPEKGDFDHREEFVKLHYGSADAENDLPQTKAVVVGGVVALRFYLELLGSQNTGESQSGLRWPELAAYDCSGCHHELKSPSWRQLRSDFGQGRPRMLEWPVLIAEHISMPLLNDDAATTKFKSHMKTLRELLAQRPFGPPGTGDGSLSAEALQFAVWLKSIEQQLADKSYDRDTARQALANVVGANKAELWDYYTARQLADAYRTIRLEVRTGYPEFTEDGETPQAKAESYLKQLNDWNCDKVAKQSQQIDMQLTDQLLQKPLSLMLLTDFVCNKEPALALPAMNEKIWLQRSQMLENAAKYDAVWFQRQFGQLNSGSASK